MVLKITSHNAVDKYRPSYFIHFVFSYSLYIEKHSLSGVERQDLPRVGYIKPKRCMKHYHSTFGVRPINFILLYEFVHFHFISLKCLTQGENNKKSIKNKVDFQKLILW